MALSEHAQIVGTAQLLVAWLEGDVLAEYVRFLEEVEEKVPAAGPGGVKWLEGDVLAEFLRFLGEDESVVQDGSSRSSSGSNSGDHMEEEDENEMEYLLRHIMSLPAFMARAAAASLQE